MGTVVGSPFIFAAKKDKSSLTLVCYTAVFSVVTQRLRDDTKNGCVADYINPLSPNSDQGQFSPNNVHTLSTDKL